MYTVYIKLAIKLHVYSIDQISNQTTCIQYRSN